MEVEQARQYVHMLDEMSFIVEHPNGYWVRFTKKFEKGFGLLQHQMFSHDELEAAKVWRDMTYFDLLVTGQKLPHTQRRPVWLKEKQTNTVGRVGIQLIDSHRVRRDSKTGVAHDIWEYGYKAVWVEYKRIEGKVVRKIVTRWAAIRKYGEDEAYRRIVEIRQKAEKYLTSKEHIELWMEYHN